MQRRTPVAAARTRNSCTNTHPRARRRARTQCQCKDSKLRLAPWGKRVRVKPLGATGIVAAGWYLVRAEPALTAHSVEAQRSGSGCNHATLSHSCMNELSRIRSLRARFYHAALRLSRHLGARLPSACRLGDTGARRARLHKAKPVGRGRARTCYSAFVGRGDVPGPRGRIEQ